LETHPRQGKLTHRRLRPARPSDRSGVPDNLIHGRNAVLEAARAGRVVKVVAVAGGNLVVAPNPVASTEGARSDA